MVQFLAASRSDEEASDIVLFLSRVGRLTQFQRLFKSATLPRDAFVGPANYDDSL